MDIADWLTFDNQTCTLDLNGKTLSLLTKMKNMPTFMRVYRGSNLTIKDSQGGGQITGKFENTGASDSYLIDMHQSSLTLEGGTFRATAEPYGTNVNVINYLESNVTIKDGVTISQPEHYAYGGGGSGLKGHGYALCEQQREFNYGDEVSHVVIDGGIFDGWVRLIGYPDTNGSVQINGGTFKKGVQALYVAKKNNSDPTVTVNGGTFEDNVYLQDWDWKESLYMPYRLNGGTFKGTVDLHAVNNITVYQKPESNPNVALGLNECFGYSAVVTPDGTFAGPDAKTGVLKKTGDYDYDMWLEGTASNPVRIIPNAWGMKSVTLDGKEIDYFKDWTGEWKRVGNNQDHTLGFEWYLSDDMKKAGYTYDAKYLLYRTNSSDEPTPIPVDTSKNTLELKIEKDALPGGYSYDFRLDLQKNGVDLLGSSTNQHIVMLVVYPAQVETKAITAVNLTVPELNAGATAGSAVTLTASTPADSCTAGTTTWNIPASGAEQSATYYATVTLTAQDGYAFGSGTAVKLTGDHVSQTASISGDGKTMTVRIGVAAKHVHKFGPWTKVDDIYHKRTCSCTYSEQKTHNWVVDNDKSTVTNKFYKCSDCGADGGVSTNSKVVDQLFIGITHPIDGDLPDGDPSRWAKIHGPASCMDNASIKSVRWYELDGTTPVTRFEAGKRYSVSITFEAHADYRFVESDNFNTKAPDFEVGTKTRSENGAEMTVVYTLSAEKPVQKMLEVEVELPSLNAKVGQQFPEGKLVNASDGIKLSGGFLPNEEDGIVQAGKEYVYIGQVTSENSLDSISVVIRDEGDAVAAAASGGLIVARYHTPDPNKIDIVALTVTAPKYGETPATSAAGANDTLYTVDTPTWSPAVTDGKFGEAAYTVSIPVTVAASGYSFDANCVYTVNGYVATYADGKVSYTFPALTAPHTHDYSGQPYLYLDPGNHYQECKENDGGYNIQAHEFTPWTDNGNGTHSRHCNVCKMTDGSTYTETVEHTWVWVVDQEAALNQPGLQHEECTGCHAKRNENTEIPALRDYAVTVTGGTATVTAGTPITRAMEGVEVTVTAQAPAGKHFVKWVVKAGGVTLANETSATTTFIMPATDVKIEANFEKNGSTGGGGGGGVTTYPITVKSAKNGDVTASHKSASKGTTVTLTVAPDKGYVLDTLTVLDGNNKDLKLTEKNGKFTFTMPASKVTVAATFKASAPTGKNPFIDVPAGSYYEDAVVWAVEKGITSGTSAVTFDPNGNCTRAQAVTFLWRAAGSPAPKTKVMPFTDVPSGSYYYDAVLWAMEQGITKGTSDTAFSPNASCTRAQIVTFLWRANGSPAVSGNSAFTDVASDAYYAAAVTWAEKNGVTGGIGGGLFGSNNNCTRAQIVTFLYRAMK